ADTLVERLAAALDVTLSPAARPTRYGAMFLEALVVDPDNIDVQLFEAARTDMIKAAEKYKEELLKGHDDAKEWASTLPSGIDLVEAVMAPSLTLKIVKRFNLSALRKTVAKRFLVVSPANDLKSWSEQES